MKKFFTLCAALLVSALSFADSGTVQNIPTTDSNPFDCSAVIFDQVTYEAKWNGNNIDYIGKHDVVSFNINNTVETAYKITFSYSTILEGVTVDFVIKDASDKEVFKSTIETPCTSGGQNDWSNYVAAESAVTPVLSTGAYKFYIYYGEGLWQGGENPFACNINNIKFIATEAAGGASGTTIYSWTGAEAGATEIGGKTTCTNEGNVNKKNTANGVDYYTIVVSGKADWSGDLVTITLDNELEADDQIAITGYRNKDAADKQTGALIKFDKGDETVSTAQTGLEYPNLNPDNDGDSNAGTEPSTVTVSVPASAAGSKVLTITRAKTQTNLFITALKITRGGAATSIEAVQAVKVAPVNNFIYNLAGQRVDANYKGVVIKNGKKYLQK